MLYCLFFKSRISMSIYSNNLFVLIGETFLECMEDRQSPNHHVFV